MDFSHFKRGQRCPVCKQVNMSGKKHPNWKGGYSRKDYCGIWWDKDYKKDILIRDNFECRNEKCEGKSKNLVVHHKDYNKTNCNPINLITLCRSCHAKTNFNRANWQKKFVEEIEDAD